MICRIDNRLLQQLSSCISLWLNLFRFQGMIKSQYENNHATILSWYLVYLKHTIGISLYFIQSMFCFMRDLQNSLWIALSLCPVWLVWKVICFKVNVPWMAEQVAQLRTFISFNFNGSLPFRYASCPCRSTLTPLITNACLWSTKTGWLVSFLF